MKTLLITCCLLITTTLVNAESYTPPTSLNSEEVKKSHNDLVNNKIKILDHWKARVAMATANKTKISKSGIPLQKPYYGDSGLMH